MSENKRPQPTPLSMEEVAEMLRRATEAVTANNPRSAQRVRDMLETDLRRDPVLGAAFQRGWDACAAAVNRTLRIAVQPPTKRPKPNNPKAAGKPSPSSTTPKPPSKAASTTPPKPRTTTMAKKQLPKTPTAVSTSQTAGRGLASTSRESLSRKTESRPTGTPGNRKTTTTTAVTTGQTGKTARDRKYERFLEIKKRTKARKAETSQQFRLAKHPGPSSSGPSTTPPSAERQEEPMEVDAVSSGVSAPPETQNGGAVAGPSGRDDIDVYLDAPIPSLGEELVLDEDPPFFNETPPSSPGQME